MKATGFLRNIDDLGRVVIPKEIRRMLNIREGDPLEVYVDSNMVILTPYEPCKDMYDQVQDIRDRYAEYLRYDDSIGTELTTTQSEIIQQMDNLVKLLKLEARI